MMAAMKLKSKPKPKSVCWPLQIPPDLRDKVGEVAQRVGLSSADVARLAIERGTDVLLRQLTNPSASDHANTNPAA